MLLPTGSIVRQMEARNAFITWPGSPVMRDHQGVLVSSYCLSYWLTLICPWKTYHKYGNWIMIFHCENHRLTSPSALPLFVVFDFFYQIMTSLAAIFLRSNNLMVYSPLLCISICQYPMLAILVLLLITIILFIWGLTIMCCYIASAILELRHPHWHYIIF